MDEGKSLVRVFVDGRVEDITGMLFLEKFLGSIDSRFGFGKFEVSKAYGLGGGSFKVSD